MLMMFDFRCPAGHVTEKLVRRESKRIRCECGKEAVRIQSPIRSHLPANQGFPDADARWTKNHESLGGTRTT